MKLKQLYDIILNESLSDNIIFKIKKLIPKFIEAAQSVYDEWDQDSEGNDEMYGSGGICDDIADGIANVLNDNGLGSFTKYNEYDYHTSAYVVDHDKKLIVQVDIAPNNYEIGAGYNWTKIPNIKFEPEMIDIIDMSDTYDEWFDENGEAYDV